MKLDQKIILGNWKMNGSTQQNIALLESLQKNKVSQQTTIGLAVPTPYLMQVKNLIAGSEIKLGAQDVSQFYDYGAFTGEVNSQMLKDVGVAFCLIGHSERRHYFNETAAQLLTKYQNCQQQNILPILCIGETLAQRQQQLTRSILAAQLAILQDLTGNEIIVAYEPVWAIGSGQVASIEQISLTLEYIYQQILSFRCGNAKICLLYGGSVNASNAATIMQIAKVDGVLVGGASLQSAEFIDIIQAV